MSFYFFNTQTRQKEIFRPLKPGIVQIYSCGPTVYDYAHIGNFRSYIFADILRRSLQLANYQVIHALNLTDVDDKTIAGAIAKNPNATLEDLRKHTEPYAEAFFQDLKTLNIQDFTYYPKATENIEAMLEIIRLLKEKGYAYEMEGSIYFSIAKDPEYGKLSHLDLSQVKTGTRYRTDEYTKDDIRDFVLWKKEPLDFHIAWDSPYGHGRPGWHIECSAMIRKIFGTTIDIHTGGVDLIFPHHENEIAQSECAYGEPFVRYWLHCEHLLVDGKKMSKSKGNFYTLRDLLHKGYHPASIRYFLLSAHYRQKLNFTLTALSQAKEAVRRILQAYWRIQKTKLGKEKKVRLSLEDHKTQFLRELQDDLNTPRALSVVFEAIREIHSFLDKVHEEVSAQEKEAFLSFFTYTDQVLGLLAYAHDFQFLGDVPSFLQDLLLKRNEARQNKNYALADQIRDEILNQGYRVVDTKEGSYLERI